MPVNVDAQLVAAQKDASRRGAAIRGAAIAVGGQGASSIIRFISNLILTHILFPEAFGMMTIVNVVVGGVAMFADIGIQPSVVQSKRGDDPAFLNTAWTLQVLRGVLLCAIASALGWPAAKIYDIPELMGLIPAAAIGALLAGFESTKLFTEARHLRLTRLLVVELSSQLAGVVSMATFGYIFRSVWALVTGSLVAMTVKVVLSHTYLPGHRNRFAWEKAALDELVHFGRWVLASTALTFLSRQSDKLILGKLVSAASLGLYGLGNNLAQIPAEVMGNLAGRIFYPLISRMVRENEDLGVVHRLRILAMWSAVPLYGLIISMAAPAVELVYDQRYTRAGLLAAALSFGTWVGTISLPYGNVVLAHGQPKWISFGTGLKVLITVSLMVFAAGRWDIEGVAVLVALAEIGQWAMTAMGARKYKVVALWADVTATLAVLAAAAGYFALFSYLREALGDLSAPWPLLLSILITCVLGCGLSLPAFVWARRQGQPGAPS